MQSHRNTPHDLWLDALYDRAASSLYTADTPSGPSNVRAVPPETDRRGWCGTYRAWIVESFCRQYRRHKNTLTNGPSHLNQGCKECPGLDFEVTE